MRIQYNLAIHQKKILKCKLEADDSRSREREIKQYSLFSTKLALFQNPETEQLVDY